VGKVIAIVEIEGEDSGAGEDSAAVAEEKPKTPDPVKVSADKEEKVVSKGTEIKEEIAEASRFYSPLVKNIAREEGISMAELESIKGTGVQQVMRSLKWAVCAS
jgi:2-oxoglutarate dehydrogenase E2 component (dihydrolipoamide succinyltransferase)